MAEHPTNVEAHPTPNFPTANLKPRRSRQVLGSSRMWWATLAALAIAGFLVWRSIEQAGPEITIRFPEGHGLKIGDFVRHRSVDVGHVSRINLADDINSIEVSVTLLHGAEGLASEGTQFWIVRPKLSLTEIRGLDTALGPKYIAVSPGDVGNKRKLTFDGLATPPPGNVDDRGMEVVLRAENSHGLYTTAPVTWRGVDVGEVLSVDLASDTRYVDIRVRIDSAYQKLARSNSRFWATGGLGIDAGFTGFTLKAESLATIARGGVSFITPADDKATPVRPGHVFTLHAEEDPEWTAAASTVSLIDFPLPPTVTLRATWKEKTLGFTRSRQRDIHAMLVAEPEQQAKVIAPEADVRPPSTAIEGTWHLALFAAGVEGPLAELGTSALFKPRPGGIAESSLSPKVPGKHAIAIRNLRTPAMPEDCCLVRSVAGKEGPSSVIHSLSRTELLPVSESWRVDPAGIDLEDWHGAVVASTADGATIGMFLATDEGPFIALITK